MENNDLNEPKASKRGKKIPTAIKIVAKVCTESGMTQKETATQLGVSEDTIQRAIMDPTLDREIIEKAKIHLPVKMYNVAMTIAERLSTHPELLEKMNPYMSALVLGIMIDKSRLMQGESTENLNVQSKVIQIQAALESISELRKKLGLSPSSPDNS